MKSMSYLKRATLKPSFIQFQWGQKFLIKQISQAVLGTYEKNTYNTISQNLHYFTLLYWDFVLKSFSNTTTVSLRMYYVVLVKKMFPFELWSSRSTSTG